MSVFNISIDPPEFQSSLNNSNKKLMSSSSINFFGESQKRNKFTPLNSSTLTITAPSYKQLSQNSSTTTLTNPQQHFKQSTFKKLNDNLLKCKSIKTYQTAQPNHLSFDFNDTIVITNNSNKDLWVSHFNL